MMQNLFINDDRDCTITATIIITKVTEEKEKGPVEYNVSDVSPTIKNLGNDALYVASCSLLYSCNCYKEGIKKSKK